MLGQSVYEGLGTAKGRHVGEGIPIRGVDPIKATLLFLENYAMTK
jgi:hypothetical protein